MRHVLESAPEHYRADVQRLNDALAPHVYTDTDGWVGIDPTTAPPRLLELYGSLASAGYANGWLS